jgi:hypothetical protein
MCNDTNHYALKLQFFIGTIELKKHHKTFVTSLWLSQELVLKILADIK